MHKSQFLQRVSIVATQSAVLAMIDSIRPSVTRWYHAKTTPATITRSSLEDSPMTLVYKFIDFCSGSSSKEYH